ncbi:hypothetical protein D3C74_377630 [compost metagenome]
MSSRLSGLLDLIVRPEDLQKIDIDKVKSVVKWRNNIAHRTGHLPDGLSEAQLLEGINNVFALTMMLGVKTAALKSMHPNADSLKIFNLI